MASQALRLRDERILETIAETPLTAREIGERLLQRAREEWAEENGYEIEWGDHGRGPNEPVGARVLAASYGRERGCVYSRDEVYARLVALERRGEVERITPPGGRGILWMRTGIGG